MNKQLTEKYRPKTIDEYVFKDEHLKNKVMSYIKASKNENNIPFPNLLLGGIPGTGKTSLAYLLCYECNVQKSDIMYINASRENNIETVRNKINNFCSTMPMGNFKVIILDEFDRMSLAGQDALKSMFETYISTVRFIATANQPEKVSEALHSRFQVFSFKELDKDIFIDRIGSILISENISFDPENLENIVDNVYPDLRKAINVIDQFTINGELTTYVKQDVELNVNAIEDMITFTKAGKYKKLQEISKTIPPHEIEDFFVYLYRNIETIIDDEDYYGAAFVIIRDALVDLEKKTIPDLHLSATICQLCELNK